MKTRRKFLTLGIAALAGSVISSNAATAPTIPREVKKIAEKLDFKIRPIWRNGQWRFRLDVPGDDYFFGSIWNLYWFCKGVDWQRKYQSGT